MPTINIDLRQTPLIDAQLSVSFSHLSDVIRLVIDNSNMQEQRIVELQAQVSALLRRNDELDTEMRGLREEARMAIQVTSALDGGALERALQPIRDDTRRLKENAESTYTELRQDLDGIRKKLLQENQSTSIAFSTTHEKWESLSKAMVEVQAASNFARGFATLWGADAESVNAALSVASAANDDFVLSLPAMKLLRKDLDTLAKTALTTEDQSAVASLKHSEFTEIINRLHDSITTLRHDVDALHGRQQPRGDVSDRVKELEEKVRVLDATKADLLSLSAKTDKDTTTTLSQRIAALQDELSALLEGGGGGGVAGARKLNANGGVADDNIRRRVTALETETVRLEQNKADRSELTKLYDTVDAISRNSSQQIALVSAAEADGASPSSVKVRPPSMARRPQSSPGGDRVAVPVPASASADMSAQGKSNSSPQRTGSASGRPLFVGRSATISVRDSSGGITPVSLSCTNR